MISGFHREVDEKCALLGYYAASIVVVCYRLLGQTIRPISKGQEATKKKETRTAQFSPQGYQPSNTTRLNAQRNEICSVRKFGT